MRVQFFANRRTLMASLLKKIHMQSFGICIRMILKRVRVVTITIGSRRSTTFIRRALEYMRLLSVRRQSYFRFSDNCISPSEFGGVPVGDDGLAWSRARRFSWIALASSKRMLGTLSSIIEL